MRATEHRIRAPRLPRRYVTLPAPEPAVEPAVELGLGLSPVELEDLLLAVGEFEDTAGPDRRARLARGRAALEAELARSIA